jgi:GH24 family phage-related lysozyme (muramidase)
MTLRVGPRAVALMHHFEGCRLHAYKCPVGIWTIGWGDTGPHVKEGLVWTQAQADEAFRNRLAREFEPGVAKAIGAAFTTPAQFGAMVALAYNIGVGAFNRSGVATHHRAGRHEAASKAFMSWTKGGRPLRSISGLVRRRNVERMLYDGRIAEFDAAIGFGR